MADLPDLSSQEWLARIDRFLGDQIFDSGTHQPLGDPDFGIRVFVIDTQTSGIRAQRLSLTFYPGESMQMAKTLVVQVFDADTSIPVGSEILRNATDPEKLGREFYANCRGIPQGVKLRVQVSLAKSN